MPEQKNPKRPRIVLRIFLGLFLLLTVFGVSFYIYALNWQQNNLAIPGNEGESVSSVTSKPGWGASTVFLIVGSDKRPDWNTSRADAIILVTMSADGKKVDVLSIPRDTRALVPGRGYEKINYSLTLGGGSLLIDSVENLTDTEINYYFEVDYAGFIGLIDSLGGIEYKVEKGWFSEEFDVLVREGTFNRSGLEALAVLKSRQFVRGDAQRVDHQQAFVRAMVKQLMDKPTEFPTLLRAIGHNAKTNITLSEMLKVGFVAARGKPEMQTETLRGSLGMLRGVSYSFISEEE